MRRLIPRFIRRFLVRNRLRQVEIDLAMLEETRARVHSDIADGRRLQWELRREISRIEAGLA